jgi:putative addiction module component (TIGR02574 family)
MPGLFEELQISRFTADERLQLVGDIWDSMAAEVEVAPLPPALCEELDRRLAAHRADPGTAIPWEQVQRDALARLRKK